MSKKQRIDLLLVEKGLFTSREKAKAAIMAGIVLVNNQKVDKAGTEVPVLAEIRVMGNNNPYVSRGGLKLAKAMESFELNLHNKVVMDVGASTGGFTHCALEAGAAKVYAIDVGYGQLAWSLRQNPQVINMERTNIRYLEPESLEELPEFVTIDVSFISLTKVLDKIFQLTQTPAEVVALIKPQFEAGRDNVGKRGVVRDSKVHEAVINQVLNYAVDTGFYVNRLDFSPIRGPEGNIEYLVHLLKGSDAGQSDGIDVSALVSAAHSDLTN